MSPSKKNHYQVLGIEPSVSASEIKRAYRKMVKSRHPDLQNGNGSDSDLSMATEDMMVLNEAYETLMDAAKRAQYDIRIGLRKSRPTGKPKLASVSEDEARERFLRQVFHPSRSAIVRILSLYKKQIRRLSLDPFDDELLSNFQEYANQIESVLRKSSDALSRSEPPPSLRAAVHIMRNSIAQAADGLEEMRYFCLNFDYDHLKMAENLFKIASDLSKESLDLTKTGRY